jgi:hypothetical protein
MLQNWALENDERPQPFLLGPIQTLFLLEIGLNALKTKFQNYIALKYCLLRALGSPPMTHPEAKEINSGGVKGHDAFCPNCYAKKYTSR